MSANPLPSVDATIYAVREWKETLGPECKWWQKWFHRFIYLPFNEFSLKIVKIPPVTSATLCGDKVQFSWLEDGGFFASEDEADVACLTNRYSYQGMPFGRAFPSVSGQLLGPTIFPRAKNPRKREQPILSLVFKDRKKDEQEQRTLAEYLQQLHQVLDR